MGGADLSVLPILFLELRCEDRATRRNGAAFASRCLAIPGADKVLSAVFFINPVQTESSKHFRKARDLRFSGMKEFDAANYDVL
jgi:hypothetical protein